jgi:hypothetical protein
VDKALIFQVFSVREASKPRPIAAGILLTQRSRMVRGTRYVRLQPHSRHVDLPAYSEMDGSLQVESPVWFRLVRLRVGML